MTGPGEGKLKLEAEVYVNGEPLLGADVYIHVKGYSLARVTHLDVEHEELNGFVKPKSGRFLKVMGVKHGLRVEGRQWVLVVKSKELEGLLGVGEETYAWVGGKFGGIYIGFKKKYVEKLEEKAWTLFGVRPRAARESL
ncbi:MAG: hypothetical protein DRJ68_07220 [Thermoprotei archaeon]|nr:MAG: hypothetical protein DRJ68_07220 [Thermoprotei archaeon]